MGHRHGGSGYLVAHACFACRKSTKHPPRDIARSCACCGGPLHPMGRAFKAPPVRDIAQWRKVQRLHEAGFRFWRYRSTEGARLPARLSDVERFIRENPKHPLRVSSYSPADDIAD